MNKAFSSSRIAFKLKGITYTVNDTWAASTWEGPSELEYKTLLRKGTYKDLNLYFISKLGQGFLGYCNFPVQNPSAESRILDGCVNLAASMPGDEAENYNMGATAVHEIAHWLGLFHTFDGASCTGSGDYVSDTPMQLNATGGCPTVSNTCPKRAGDDPIHNYMDYSFDSCMWEFSKGQTRRMRSMYQDFRFGK